MSSQKEQFFHEGLMRVMRLENREENEILRQHSIDPEAITGNKDYFQGKLDGLAMAKEVVVNVLNEARKIPE